MLSCVVVIICKNILIINLFGSLKVVIECLEYIINEFKYGLEILIG